MMIKITCSLAHWMFKNGYQKELALLYFGHMEVFTPEMERSYLEWCKTDEGKSYLQGGANYQEPA